MKNPAKYNDQAYINDVLAIALNHASQSKDDHHRPLWHFSPLFGLLNDPNGLAHFNGEYHLFYQWNPKACTHGAKAWGHASSKDMINWTHQPLALAPTEDFETHGCYSGSGLVVDGKLELFYTGNVKFTDGGRTAYQCRATFEPGFQVEKQGIVLELPKGYSGHVRDPKVWVYEDKFYMVLGAEDLDYKGKVLLYRSDDLNNWQMVGEVFGDGQNGYQSDDFMLECPDLFPLEDKHVLVSCPKNWIERDNSKIETFDVTYHVGDLDYQSAAFSHDSGVLMDQGFDFYAPQTFEDEQGRRILFGWMGKPDEFESYQPTIDSGWIHQMTCPRELTLRDGVVLQNPVKELETMRRDEQRFSGLIAQFDGLSAELLLEELEGKEVRIDIADDLKLEVDAAGLKTWRKNLKTGAWEFIAWQGTVASLRILRDLSCVEVFVNGGETVSTSRFFGQATGDNRNSGFVLSSSNPVSGCHWQLTN
ncbi:sucrose-6-phosphate hydrolase [Vibrio sp. JC009]|uniref:glycoside hydrolase family 32 protein n=1 Tax=Vibrio sp. JC009 TaxID=2912314 RepID=UPI0023AE88EC|nr:sucrose-6-phosphate hydrolase [Vibrio sp. JC009]WED20868.1 sucrose-6-phosphate hydrolase [Vibrio sp. JC009]